MRPKVPQHNFLDPEERERLNTVLDSEAWKLAIIIGLRASIQEWNDQLLHNENLSDSDRKGYIFAKRSLQRGLESLYEKLNRNVPQWLKEEFDGRS